MKVIPRHRYWLKTKNCAFAMLTYWGSSKIAFFSSSGTLIPKCNVRIKPKVIFIMQENK